MTEKEIVFLIPTEHSQMTKKKTWEGYEQLCHRKWGKMAKHNKQLKILFYLTNN